MKENHSTKNEYFKKGFMTLSCHRPGTIISASDTYYRLTGYSKSEYLNIQNNYAVNIIYPDDLDNLIEEINSQLNKGDHIISTYRIIRKDGTLARHILKATRIKQATNVTVLKCCIRDISCCSASNIPALYEAAL